MPGVRRYHRTLSTLLNGLIDAGFAIERTVESTPSEGWLRERPHDADERRRPMFLLVRASATQTPPRTEGQLSAA